LSCGPSAIAWHACSRGAFLRSAGHAPARRSALKGAVALTARAPCPPSHPARAPLPSRTSTRYRSRATTLVAPLASPVADPAPPCLGQAPVSLESDAQHRPLVDAAELARRPSRSPKSCANRVLDTPRALPRLSPAARTGEPPEFWPEPHRPAARATLRGGESC
jgi:hypothetical protein